MKPPPLLARFPKLRAPKVSWPVIPAEKRSAYPALADDFAFLDQEVTPVFERYDQAALRDQNRYRRQQVLIFTGSALLTGFGGLQAVFPGQRWPGIVLAVLGIVLATSTRMAGEQSMQADYLNARVRTERLRGLHFQYLARAGKFAGADREAELRTAVLAISAGREPQ